MTARQLLVQFVFAAGTLVAVNAAVERFAANTVPRRLLQSAALAEPATDVFLGNSTMAAGLDEASFARAHAERRPLNLGLGASSPVEHYLIYRQQHKHSGADVYYGYFDTQLTDDPSGEWDDLVGNRAMAYYVEPEVARRFYTAGSPLRDLAFRLIASVPMAVERNAIWAKVERVRRRLGGIGVPARDRNRFGRAEDFAFLELETEDFVKRCELAVNQRSPLCAPAAALFDQVRDSGSKLYVVEMPMPTSHRERYYHSPAWKAYQERIKKLVHAYRGVYVEASDWVPDDGFADAVHLNSRGAEIFSAKLGGLVSDS